MNHFVQQLQHFRMVHEAKQAHKVNLAALEAKEAELEKIIKKMQSMKRFSGATSADILALKARCHQDDFSEEDLAHAVKEINKLTLCVEMFEKKYLEWEAKQAPVLEEINAAFRVAAESERRVNSLIVNTLTAAQVATGYLEESRGREMRGM